MEFDEQLKLITDTANFFKFCDVLDIEFVGGIKREVYVAISPDQRSRGLAEVAELDLNLDGMLFCFEEPSYVPFTMDKMMFALDIAWYDEEGALLQLRTFDPSARAPLYCHKPFSYVLEAPVGTIPASNLKVSNART